MGWDITVSVREPSALREKEKKKGLTHGMASEGEGKGKTKEEYHSKQHASPSPAALFTSATPASVVCNVTDSARLPPGRSSKN
jgi:hypothetical protein